MWGEPKSFSREFHWITQEHWLDAKRRCLVFLQTTIYLTGVGSTLLKVIKKR